MNLNLLKVKYGDKKEIEMDLEKEIKQELIKQSGKYEEIRGYGSIIISNKFTSIAFSIKQLVEKYADEQNKEITKLYRIVFRNNEELEERNKELKEENRKLNNLVFNHHSIPEIINPKAIELLKQNDKLKRQLKESEVDKLHKIEKLKEKNKIDFVYKK